MKRSIFLIILAFQMTKCYSQLQNEKEIWLARKYVESVVDGDCDGEKLLMPVEGFMILQDSVYMLTYRGELSLLESNICIKCAEKYSY